MWKNSRLVCYSWSSFCCMSISFMTVRFPKCEHERKKQHTKNQLLIDHVFFFYLNLCVSFCAPSTPSRVHGGGWNQCYMRAYVHKVISQLVFSVTNVVDMLYRSSGMFIAARDFITYLLFGSIRTQNHKMGRKNQQTNKKKNPRKQIISAWNLFTFFAVFVFVCVFFFGIYSLYFGHFLCVFLVNFEWRRFFTSHRKSSHLYQWI